MKIAVVLGYWLNNDGTPNQILINRLNQTLELIEDEHPDKIIVSGGIANKLAGRSEASVMYEYLVSKGVDKDMIIIEDKSHTTHQNAIYSCDIARSLGVDTLIITSSLNHFTSQPYNTYAYFADELKGLKVKLMIYSTTE